MSTDESFFEMMVNTILWASMILAVLAWRIRVKYKIPWKEAWKKLFANEPPAL